MIKWTRFPFSHRKEGMVPPIHKGRCKLNTGSEFSLISLQNQETTKIPVSMFLSLCNCDFDVLTMQNRVPNVGLGVHVLRNLSGKGGKEILLFLSENVQEVLNNN